MFLERRTSVKMDRSVFNQEYYSASSSTFRYLDFIRAVQWFHAASPMVYS